MLDLLGIHPQILHCDSFKVHFVFLLVGRNPNLVLFHVALAAEPNEIPFNEASRTFGLNVSWVNKPLPRLFVIRPTTATYLTPADSCNRFDISPILQGGASLHGHSLMRSVRLQTEMPRMLVYTQKTLKNFKLTNPREFHVD